MSMPDLSHPTWCDPRTCVGIDATTADQPAEHPSWCSQGAQCDQQQYVTGGQEWAHGTVPWLLDADRTTSAYADVFVIRMDRLLENGQHLADVAITVEAEGSMCAAQARALAHALLRAADQYDAAQREAACFPSLINGEVVG
jgi:hypothetical protein